MLEAVLLFQKGLNLLIFQGFLYLRLRLKGRGYLMLRNGWRWQDSGWLNLILGLCRLLKSDKIRRMIVLCLLLD